MSIGGRSRRAVLAATVLPLAGGLMASQPATAHAEWFTETAAATAGALPYGVASVNGTTFFTESGTNRVARVNPNGTVTEVTIPNNGANSQPRSIVAGPAADPNALYFVLQAFGAAAGNAVARIDANTLAITKVPIPTANAGSEGITVGPDGNIWFTETAVGQLGEMAPCVTTGCTGSETVRETAIPVTAPQPFQITAGPTPAAGQQGTLYFTDRSTNANAIGRVPLVSAGVAGTITELATAPAPNPNNNPPLPYGITVGPDNNLWYTEQQGDQVVQLVPATPFSASTQSPFLVPTPASAPRGITSGPDGSIYFAENKDNGIDPGKIGRLSPTVANGAHNVFEEFGVPTIGAAPNQIARGTGASAGQLLVTENGANRVGSIGAAESGYLLDLSGGLHPWGLTSLPPYFSSAEQANHYWPGGDTVRGMALRSDGRSGYVLDLFGGLHAFGGAPDPGPQDATSGHHFTCDCAKQVVLDAAGTAGYVLDQSGGLHPFAVAGAALPNPGDQTSHVWPGNPNVVRGMTLDPADASGDSGWVIDLHGGMHPFGISHFPLNPTDFLWPAADNIRAVVATGNGVGYVLDLSGVLHGFRTVVGGLPAPSAGDMATQAGHDWVGQDVARGLVMDVGGNGGYVLDLFGLMHAWGTAGIISVPAQAGNNFTPHPFARGVGGLA